MNRFKGSLSFLVILVALIGVGCVGSANTKQGIQDENKVIKGVLTTFIKNIENGDVDAATSVLVEATNKANSRDLLSAFHNNKSLLKLQVESVDIEGDKAKAKCVVSIKNPNSPKDKTYSEVVALLKVNDQWKIGAPSEAKAEEFINTIAHIVKNGPSASITSGKSEAQCKVNMKELAIDLTILFSDNDFKLAFTNQNWVDKVKPYLKRNNLLDCPLDTHGAMSYSINTNLSKKDYTASNQIAKLVLLYEGKNQKLSYRHDGKAGVVFADVHFEWVDSERAKKLVWKL